MDRILIVAAYASVRAGLRSLLSAEEDFDVVEEVSGSAGLEEALVETTPDVVLFDHNASDSSTLLEIMEETDIGLVVLGDAKRNDLQALAEHFLHGWAYLLKESDGHEIAGAIRAVSAGLVVLDHSFASLLTSPETASLPQLSTGVRRQETLTPREHEVLQLMALGLPNKNIAVRLDISLHTVKFHVASILTKLGASSRTEAVTVGARTGQIIL